MKLKLVRAAGLMIALAALSACSMFAPTTPDRLMLGLSPNNELGYEISTGGEITITNRTLVLSTRAGMPVTNVTGYRIEYYDELDNLVGSSSFDAQTLNVTVPAGFVCPEPVDVLGCTATSAGARPAPGQAVEVAGLASQLLSGDIAAMHAGIGSPAGWYAILTLYYDNARGTFAEEYALYIVAPN